MKTVYPVIFTQTNDKKDTYLIDIPDIGGLSEGNGLADAIHMARDLIGCKLYELKDEQYPKASAMDSMDISKGEFFDSGKSFISMVDIDMDQYRKEMDNQPIRRNVSLPSWLNKKANEAHINVSRVLQDALIEKLNV